MKRWMVGIAVMAVLMVAGTARASVDVLTFDDLPTPDLMHGDIPNGYGGLNWSNLWYLNGDTFSFRGNHAYQPGVVSPHNVAFNAGGNSTATVSGGVFTFNGAYLTSVYDDNTQITVTGYLSGATICSRTVTVNHSGPTWFAADYVGIDSLRFASSNRQFFAMDNFTFAPVPEPSSIVILSGLGAMGLVAIAWRRARSPRAG
jgi:hypothetical protein